jgi:hypothetical protein
LSWAISKPMTATVDLMVKLLPLSVDPSKVCLACKDKTKCQTCCFRITPTEQELKAFEAVI